MNSRTNNGIGGADSSSSGSGENFIHETGMASLQNDMQHIDDNILSLTNRSIQLGARNRDIERYMNNFSVSVDYLLYLADEKISNEEKENISEIASRLDEVMGNLLAEKNAIHEEQERTQKLLDDLHRQRETMHANIFHILHM